MPAAAQSRELRLSEMSDHQVLAHLLTLIGRERHDARELAHALLDDREKGLDGVFAMSPEELLRFPGLGDEAASFLRLIPVMATRYLNTGHVPELPAPTLTLKDLTRFLEPELPGVAAEERGERVCIFCLGNGLEVLTAALLATGGPEEVSCSVPRLLDLALTHRSKGVILAHNHPNGPCAFSKSDLVSTNIVSNALTAVKIPLVDHLLLSEGTTLSLRWLFSGGLLTGLPFQPPKLWSRVTSPFYRGIVIS